MPSISHIVQKTQSMLTLYILTLLMVFFLVTQLILSPFYLLKPSLYETLESFLVTISVNFEKVLSFIVTGGHNKIYLYLDPLEEEEDASSVSSSPKAKKMQHWNQVKKLFQLNGSALVISNHVGTADWITLFNFFDHHLHSAGKIRYMMKRQHLYVPVIGTAAWLRRMIFLRKDFEEDKKTIMNSMLQFEKMNSDCWILLYPEGTFVTPSTLPILHKVQEYAQKNDLPVMEHVLTPRTKGVQLCLHRTYRHMFKQVISVTVAYSKPYDVKIGEAFAPTMINFFEYRKENPTDIHVHFQVYPMESLRCEDDQQISEWTHKEFLKKEKLLKHFREHGKFPGRQHERPLMFRDWFLFVLLICIWGVAVSTAWKLHWMGKLVVLCIFSLALFSAAFLVWYDYIHQNEILIPNKNDMSKKIQ